MLMRGVARALDGCHQFFFDAFTSLTVNGITGDYVEFGSWGGNTMKAAYDEISSHDPRHMWAFDSFEGLPDTGDPHDSHPSLRLGGTGQGGVEQFREACDAHGIPRHAYTAVEGFYDQTLPPLGVDGPPFDIALAYLDCNLHSSTATVLEFLAPRLKHGMILAFDDWHLWSPNDVSGERRAFADFAAKRPEWHFERYKDVHRAGVSFVVEQANLLG
jgi:hypothetical protein